MSVHAELERLRKRHGGVLMPEQVIKAARPKTSPLHGSFDWDDTKAARKWRIEQARRLIRVFVAVIGNDGNKRETRMYISLSTDRNGQGGYRIIEDVLSDTEMRSTLLQDAYEDMGRFRQKYAALQELAEVFRAMEKVKRNQKTKTLVAR